MVQELANPVVLVDVTVTTREDGTPDIQCWPNPVPVDAFHTLIVFTLDTRGWRFRTTNAVEVADPHPDFPFPSWTILPNVCSLVDLCNTQATFKYTVNLVNTLTDAEYSFDPIIKNGDGGTGGGKP